MNLIGTRTIETDRLILRKIREDDYVLAYKNWCSDKDVTLYVTWDVHSDISVTKEFISSRANDYTDSTFRWIMEYKENHEVIGTIDAIVKNNDCACEVGYAMGKKYWNKGIMTEALKSVIKYMFMECDINLIYAKYLSKNIGSGKVMKKAGMKYETTLRDGYIDKNGEISDLVFYSITKKDYLNRLNNTLALSYLNKEVTVKIDRKLGSKHPKYGFIYTLNYGYIPDTISGDGEELDAYVLGVYDDVESFKGNVIAVIHRLNDDDDKLVVAPSDKEYSNDTIRELTMFQERFFKSVILR